jgi:hypothetical protein
MRIQCHRGIYVDVGTERYPLRGALKRAQDIAAKNISDGRHTILSTLYYRPFEVHQRVWVSRQSVACSLVFIKISTTYSDAEALLLSLYVLRF